MTIILRFRGFFGRHRVSILATALLLCLVPLGLAVLPELGLRWGLIKELSLLGMSKVSVQDTDIRILGGRVVVRGVSAQPGLGEALGLGALDVLFDWKPLLDKRVAVSRADLDGLTLSIRRSHGVLEINGISLPDAPPAASAADAPAPWSVDIGELHFTQGHIRYADDLIHLDLAIGALDVSDIRSWQPDLPTHFHLAGTLESHPIEINGTLQIFAETPHLTLTVDGDDLDLAPFAPALKALGVELAAGRLSLHLSANADFNPQPVADLDGAVAVTDGKIGIDGKHADWSRLSWTGKAQWAENAELTGKLAVKNLAVPDLLHVESADATLTRVTLDPKTDDVSGAVAIALQSADWIDPDASVAVKALNLNLNQIQWKKGQGSAQIAAAIDGLTARMDGTSLDVDSAQATGDPVHLDTLQNRLDWTGSLSAQNPVFVGAGVKAEPRKLVWTGTLNTTPGASFHADGHVQDAGAKVGLPGYKYSHNRLTLDGAVDMRLDRPTPTLSAQVTLAADGFKATDESGRQTLAAAGHVDVGPARLAQSGALTVERLRASDAKVLKSDGPAGYPWRMEIGSADLARLSVTPEGAASVGSLGLDKAVFRLTRTTGGIVGLSPSQPSSAPSPQMSLGRLTLGNSRLDFEDRSLAEPMRMALTDLALTVSDLDTGKPDGDSPYDLKVKAEAATVSARGNFRPFADRPTASVAGTVTAFELPRLSAYAADALGVELQTGHLDGDARLGVDKGALSGKIQLTLSNLAVAEPNGAARFTKQAGMPLQRVLGLLKDDQDRIHLTVPVDGDISDPHYDVSDAVSQAIGGALKSTAITTLEVLFPVAGLIDLLSDDGGGAMTLDALFFPAGLDGLDPSQAGRIATIGDLLKSRPQVNLTLCGIATVAADWPVLLEQRQKDQLGFLYRLQKALDLHAKPDSVEPDRDALLELAARRSAAVKSALMDKAGIDPGRLYECHPQVETDPKSAPGVRLSL